MSVLDYTNTSDFLIWFFLIKLFASNMFASEILSYFSLSQNNVSARTHFKVKSNFMYNLFSLTLFAPQSSECVTTLQTLRCF